MNAGRYAFLLPLVLLAAGPRAGALDTTPPTVLTVEDQLGADLVGQTISVAPTQIVVTFSEGMDAPTVDENTLRVIASGGDGTFADGNEVVIMPDSVVCVSDTATLSLSAALVDDEYMVVTGSLEGVFGHWSFDEGTGSSAFDSSPNSYDGDLVNMETATDWVAGKVGGALDFESDDCVSVTGTASLVPRNAMTIAAWIWADSWSGGNRRIVGMSDSGIWGQAYDNPNGLRFLVGGVAGGDIYASLPGTGAWHHVAGTYDGSSVRLFVDGTLVQENPATGTMVEPTNDICIGSKSPGSPSRDFFDGRIDDVRIYRTALDDAAVAELATDQPPLPAADLAGNLLDGDNDGQPGPDHTTTFILNTAAPAVDSIVRVDASPTNATSVDFTVTFTEGVSGVDETDFTVTQVSGSFVSTGTISVAPAGPSATYTVTVSGIGGTGELRLDLIDNGTIQDLAGTGLGGDYTAGEAYAIDTDPPTVLTVEDQVGADLVGQTISVAPTQIVVTFSENMDLATVDEQTIRLVRSGGDGTFGDGNEVEIVPDGVVLAPADTATMGLASTTLPDDTYQAAVVGTPAPTSGLVAHWEFEDGPGVMASDSTGNGNDGTVQGSAVWEPGKMGDALTLDGLDDYVEVDSVASSIVGDFSFACWLKAPPLYPSGIRGGAVLAVNTAAGDNVRILWVGGGTGDNELAVLDGNSAWEAHSGTVVADDTWHHVAYVVGGSTGTVYVDGVAKATHTANSAIVSTHLCSLGQEWDSTGESDFLEGSLDDVRVYDRALIAAEVDALATIGVIDLAGNVLDGDGDSASGPDYTATFTLTGNAPTVASTSPGDGDPAVDVFASIAVTFSEPMDRPTAEAAFQIDGGVTGTFSWDVNTMTFRPSVRLADNTTYNVTITTAALDWSGQAMAAAYPFSFTTTDVLSSGTPLPAGNITNMLHLGSTAADRITGWPTSDQSVMWDFFIYAGWGPEHIQQPSPGIACDMRLSATETPLVWTDLTDADGTWGGVSGDKFEMYYAIYVIAPTTRDAKLVVSVDNNARCWMDGDPAWVYAGGSGSSPVFTLSAGVHSFIFKHHEWTGSDHFAVRFTDDLDNGMADLRYVLVDPIQPTVASIFPSDTALDVPVWSDVVIQFSEPMDTTVDPATAASLAGGTAAGAWSWTDRRTLVWTPSAVLDRDTAYTVTLTAVNGRDLTGNLLGGQSVFTFTTTTVATSTPGIADVTPSSAETGSQLTAVPLTGSGFIQGGIVHTPGAIPAFGHYYRYVKESAPWLTASASCEAWGGHLVTLSSAQEDDYVWRMGGFINGYIGFSDHVSEGNFVWVNGEPVVYTNWAAGEPSGGGEDFAHYWWGFAWNDSGGSRPYVCEFDSPAPPAVHLEMAAQPNIVATNVTFVDSGNLTFDIDLAGAAVGDWDVVLTNPDGGLAPLSTGFTVLAQHTIKPQPVTGLTATAVNESIIALSWTNPAALTGVVIFRREAAPPAFVPADGTSYLAGTAYGDAVCVYNGAASDASDTGLVELTTYYYAAYVHDADFTYSAASSANAATDDTPPFVTATFPLGQDADVPVAVTIEVTFSEPMDQAATEAALFVSGVPTGVRWWSGNTLNFQPGALLDYGTAYAVTVTTDAMDTAGKNLLAPYMFAFTTEPANNPPAASAGTDQSVDEGDLVTLDGSGSLDPDLDLLMFLWTQIGGPVVGLSDPAAEQPTFTAPSVDTSTIFTFELTVSDAEFSDTATVAVTVSDVPPSNNPPVADAGTPQTVDEGDTVTLDGSGSLDPDLDLLTFLWVQIGGPTAVLSDPGVEQPTFTAPDVGVDTILTFRLTVTDPGVLSSTAEVSVTVGDAEPPAARAGADQVVDEGATVTLDGSGSFDPDGTPITFLWVQTGGPGVALSDTAAEQPTFTAPELDAATVFAFELTVSDGKLADVDQVAVTVQDTMPPDDAETPFDGGCSASGGGAGPLALLLPLGMVVFLKRRRGTVRV